MGIDDRYSMAQLIASEAQQRIRRRTGLKVKLFMALDEIVRPEDILLIIAEELSMRYDDYKIKTRRRPIVELRFIATLILLDKIVGITLNEIRGYFDFLDHTNVINARDSGRSLLSSKDPVFTSKYLKAEKAVNEYLLSYSQFKNKRPA